MAIDYSHILKKLTEAKVDYCVVGGFAAVAHGVVRVTMDLDLAISMTTSDLGAAWDGLAQLGFQPRQPLTRKTFTDPEALRSIAESKGAKAITFFHEKQPYLIVDLLFSDEFQLKPGDRETLNLFGIACPVASVDKLIELKAQASRPKDLEDIRELKKIRKD